jgi:hypothetical protein
MRVHTTKRNAVDPAGVWQRHMISHAPVHGRGSSSRVLCVDAAQGGATSHALARGRV